MNYIINHFKKFDWMLVACALLLSLIGLISIYSSSLHNGDFLNFKKNLIFLGIGFFLMIVFSFVDWRIFRENSYLILILYFISLLGLVGLYFFAPETRGVRTWYKLGQISIDPIEFTKIILMVLLAKYFSSRHIEMYRVRHILLSGFYVGLPVALIFPQPNLGSCLLLVSLWVGVMLVSGIKLRHFLILMLCGLVLFAAAWVFFLKDYQKSRILSFFIPYDPLGISWSQNQSKIASGIGGLTGKGIGQGSQTQYGFLSEPQTDFIFAAIAEEAGLLGVVILLGLFLLLLWRITKISLAARDNFSRLFASAFCILLVAEIAIHIGMNIGFLPIIGLPLPLVSYGGSGMIATFVVLGVVQSIRTSPHFKI